MSAGTINWDLIYFRALCQYIVEEGYEVPKAILKLKVLDTPKRLPRLLAAEQIRRLERGFQKAIAEAKVRELKTPGLEQSRHDEILNIILANIG